MPKNPNGSGSNPKPPSPKVLKAAGHILSGDAKTITEAAELVGITRETLSRNLKRPEVTNAIRQMVSNRMSTIGVLKAMTTLEALMDKSGSDYVKLDASKYALGSAGVKPTSEPSRGNTGLVVQINLPAGIEAPRGVTIEHDPQPAGQVGIKAHE